MFRKLISNLSFSPALVGQLAFYAKRLRREETTRRLGLLFTVLALVVQSFAVFSPPEAANASSATSFVKGGVSSKADYLNHYDANTNNIKDLFKQLGITRNNIEDAKAGEVNSKSGVYSWGLKSHFSKSQGERSYTVKTSSGGSKTFYYRPLSLWDTGNNVKRGSYYPSYVGRSSSGMWFAILKICGNLVLKAQPPSPKCPTGTVGTYPKCTTPVAPTPVKPTPVKPTPVAPTPPKMCILNPQLPENDALCQPCPADTSLWINDVKCSANIIQTKSAANTTQAEDATAVVAKGSDTIVYSLNLENKGLAPSTFSIQEQLDDVLEYTTVTDMGGGTLTDKNLTWPTITLQPGEKQTRMFSVKVTDPIPAMGQGADDKTSYDCRIDNVFGNSVSINIECPVEKVIVEQTVAELPHTGPTENMIFAGLLLAIVSYFYTRTRMMKKEVRLIRRDLNAGTI